MPPCGIVQDVTGDAVEVVEGDQAYTGDQATQDAGAHHLPLEVVKLPEARKGFVLLPCRWVVERTLACFSMTAAVVGALSAAPVRARL